MGDEGLVPFEQARQDELVWVWRSNYQHRIDGDIAHIYQYGLPAYVSTVWTDDLPIVIPVCGAEPFVRVSHNHFYRSMPRWGGDASVGICARCLALAMTRP
jgi:hypothetical protein